MLVYHVHNQIQVKNGQEWVETNIPQAASVRHNHWQVKWKVNGERYAIKAPISQLNHVKDGGCI